LFLISRRDLPHLLAPQSGRLRSLSGDLFKIKLQPVVALMKLSMNSEASVDEATESIAYDTLRGVAVVNGVRADFPEFADKMRSIDSRGPVVREDRCVSAF
jgi:hypothetical protein